MFKNLVENLDNTLKVLGVAWSAVAFIAAAAFFFGGEWKAWSDVKAKVLDAPPQTIGKADLGKLGTRIDGIEQKIGQLESRPNHTGIKVSTAQGTTVEGNLEVEKNRWDGKAETKKTHTSMELCSDGWYVVGMRGIDTDGGKYCVSCISHVEFTCRKL